MKDELILRLLEETCKGLEGVCFPVTTSYLMPTYRALVAAAAYNHPENIFLRTIADIHEVKPDEDGNSEKQFGLFEKNKSGRRDVGPEEMRILFGQLRIVLEAIREEGR